MKDPFRIPPVIPPQPPAKPPPLPAQARPRGVSPRLPPVIPPAAPRSPQKTLADRIKALRPAAPAAPKLSILTPHELDRFKNLLVFARSTVEGYFSGKHKSPYRGSSAEFKDFREYAPGDDVANIDWRVYGRSRRFFLRQFEEETDMVVYLLVDTSASMSYAAARRQSKYLLAAKIAAALSYLMIHQGDKASLALFSDTITKFQPPGGTRRHLHQLVSDLERVKPASTTGMAAALAEGVALFRKRGRIVIVSDFLTDLPEFFDALGPFLHRKFDLLLLHVVDPDELELPAVNVAKFEDMETAERVQVEPEEIRVAYRETMRQRIDSLALEANRRQVQHSVVSTAQPYLDAIEAYLGFRGKNAMLGHDVRRIR